MQRGDGVTTAPTHGTKQCNVHTPARNTSQKRTASATPMSSQFHLNVSKPHAPCYDTATSTIRTHATVYHVRHNLSVARAPPQTAREDRTGTLLLPINIATALLAAGHFTRSHATHQPHPTLLAHQQRTTPPKRESRQRPEAPRSSSEYSAQRGAGL